MSDSILERLSPKARRMLGNKVKSMSNINQKKCAASPTAEQPRVVKKATDATVMTPKLSFMGDREGVTGRLANASARVMGAQNIKMNKKLR